MSSIHGYDNPVNPAHVAAAEYAKTIHQVLCGLEAASLSVLMLGLLAGGYLALVLFTVYLSCSEVRLPIVQYSTTPTQVRAGWLLTQRQVPAATAPWCTLRLQMCWEQRKAMQSWQ
jgi:hypothetical protein